jgi:hypothetical protein
MNEINKLCSQFVELAQKYGKFASQCKIADEVENSLNDHYEVVAPLLELLSCTDDCYFLGHDPKDYTVKWYLFLDNDIEDSDSIGFLVMKRKQHDSCRNELLCTEVFSCSEDDSILPPELRDKVNIEELLKRVLVRLIEVIREA